MMSLLGGGSAPTAILKASALKRDEALEEGIIVGFNVICGCRVRGRTLLQSKDGRADSADQGKRDGRRNARLGTQEREERYATCARQARTSRHLEQGAARPARLILNRLLPARCAVAGLGFRGLRMDRARRVRLEP